MISNNYARLKIVLDMIDPFDYDEFLRICETEGTPPLSINEYAMKVGFVLMAQGKYPDIPIEEAYMKIVGDANGQQVQGCSSCGEKKDKPLPSLISQVGNLALAVGQHTMNGLESVDEKTLEKRIDICNKCSEFRSDKRCSKCGCFMQVKAKWESAKCPNLKW